MPKGVIASHTHTQIQKKSVSLYLWLEPQSSYYCLWLWTPGHSGWKKMPCPREMDRLLTCWPPQHTDQPKQVLLQNIHLSPFQTDSHPKTTLPLTKPPGFSEIPTLSYSQLRNKDKSLWVGVNTVLWFGPWQVQPTEMNLGVMIPWETQGKHAATEWVQMNNNL